MERRREERVRVNYGISVRGRDRGMFVKDGVRKEVRKKYIVLCVCGGGRNLLVEGADPTIKTSLLCCH